MLCAPPLVLSHSLALDNNFSTFVNFRAASAAILMRKHSSCVRPRLRKRKQSMRKRNAQVAFSDTPSPASGNKAKETPGVIHGSA
jgi:hypothetical protein